MTLFWLLVALCSSAHAYDPPADPDAMIEVRQLLDYLGSVASQNKVLSGQFRYDQYNQANWSDPFDEAGNCLHVHQRTGKWPAILESYFFVENDNEYITAGGKKDNNLNRREQMFAYWQNGGLISIWAKLIVRHSGVREARGPWSDVWKEGTPKNNAIKNHLDRYYVPHMGWLRDRNVVLIFRPYNEELEYYSEIGAENMKKLWVWTFDYFTKTHDFHNIIWFLAGNSGGRRFFDRYPGNAYVDMIGFSDYSTSKPHPGNYQEMTTRIPNKIFALAEVGWRREDASARNTEDAREIIGQIKRYMPKAAYWLAWNYNHSPARQRNCETLYNDPWVLDRSNVNWRQMPPGATPLLRPKPSADTVPAYSRGVNRKQ